jgi:hypothetical protein
VYILTSVGCVCWYWCRLKKKKRMMGGHGEDVARSILYVDESERGLMDGNTENPPPPFVVMAIRARLASEKHNPRHRANLPLWLRNAFEAFQNKRPSGLQSEIGIWKGV